MSFPLKDNFDGFLNVLSLLELPTMRALVLARLGERPFSLHLEGISYPML